MDLGLFFCAAAFVLGPARDRFGLLALRRIFHEAAVGLVGLAGGAFAGWHGGFGFAVVWDGRVWECCWDGAIGLSHEVSIQSMVDLECEM
jgi:hypothetical protein